MPADRRGFSLLEVLVALAVLAIGMAALVRTAALQTDGLRSARDRTYAQWVASDVIAETRLANNAPASGIREGEATMGGQRWHWRMQIAPTAVAGIRRLDVSVYASNGKQPVLMLSGFLGARG